MKTLVAGFLTLLLFMGGKAQANLVVETPMANPVESRASSALPQQSKAQPVETIQIAWRGRGQYRPYIYNRPHIRSYYRPRYRGYYRPRVRRYYRPGFRRVYRPRGR